jgi:4-hydroxybenzoate polyprenyltransferase
MVSTSDIKTTGWIRHLPPLGQALAQLARFDRPIGWWLLLLPGWQAIILAGITQDAPLSQVLHLMVLFLVGAIVMRGAGCVINDLWDRDLDRAVARTRDRPLASGQVSVKTAFGFLASLAVIGV